MNTTRKYLVNILAVIGLNGVIYPEGISQESGLPFSVKKTLITSSSVFTTSDSLEELQSYYIKDGNKILHGYNVKRDAKLEVLHIEFYVHGERTFGTTLPLEPTSLSEGRYTVDKK